jgi:hypothetical protein
MTVAKYLWAAPASALGVVLGVIGIAAGGRLSIHTGVLEAEGRLLAWALTYLTVLEGGAAAITFGHVVLARDAALLEWTRSHERVHVRQYERWGPLFIPLYLAASAWAWACGRDPYRDNVFEREAMALEVGNLTSPPASGARRSLHTRDRADRPARRTALR